MMYIGLQFGGAGGRGQALSSSQHDVMVLAIRYVLGFWVGCLLGFVLARLSLDVPFKSMLRFPRWRKSGKLRPHICCLGSLMPEVVQTGMPLRHFF